MNRFLNKLERRLGKYAVPNLSMVLIGCFIAGYIIQAINPSMLGFMYLDPMYILKGQIWRIFTWIVVPPSSLDIFTLIMLLFYFSIGRTLERTWGTFRYNVYIFGGMLISVLAPPEIPLKKASSKSPLNRMPILRRRLLMPM